MEKIVSKAYSRGTKMKALLQPYASTKTQQVYLALTLVLCIMTVPLFQQCYELQTTVYKLRLEQGWPQFSDFYISFMVFLVINRLRNGTTYLFTPLFLRKIREKYQGHEREIRAQKAAKYIFKFVYFLFANLGGYLVLKNAYFSPISLLGHGDSTLAMKDTLKPSTVPYLKQYYLITLGYHFESFVALIFNSPNNDFGQMLFHHFLTVTLIVFSYFNNVLQIGSLVLFVHDWQDLFISLTRIIIDIKVPSVVLLLLFIAIMLTWIWGRCIAFPLDIIYRGCVVSGELYLDESQKLGVWILTVFLVFLALLNYYWLYRFIQMMLNWKSKGTPQDLQNDPSKKLQ